MLCFAVGNSLKEPCHDRPCLHACARSHVLCLKMKEWRASLPRPPPVYDHVAWRSSRVALVAPFVLERVSQLPFPNNRVVIATKCWQIGACFSMKPFKPPTLKSRLGTNTLNGPPVCEPPQKKRRISRDDEDDETETIAAAASVLKKPKPFVSFQAPTRKPLSNVANPKAGSPTVPSESHEGESYYTVLWYSFITFTRSMR